MGLAAPRKRVKLSHDPNNTNWTRDTGGFGHRIMAAQGWQPGDILGAKNAPHAEFHTAANASYIRVFVKDDNLGLGAKKGSGLAEGECTGLDVFQSLLGRLNGKDEDELNKEQNSRDNLKRAIYTERRWGSVRFVKGGFLVGDKIQELIDKEEDRLRQLNRNSSKVIAEALESNTSRSSDTDVSERPVVKRKKSKKDRRKVEKDRDQSAEVDAKKRSKSNRIAASGQDVHEEIQSTRVKKSKMKRKESQAGEESNASANEEQDISRKKKKRNKSKRQKEGTESPEFVESGRPTADQSSTPQPLVSASGSSTPQSVLGGRHAVRSRNIAQKRLAVLDSASLNQIFMIKQ